MKFGTKFYQMLIGNYSLPLFILRIEFVFGVSDLTICFFVEPEANLAGNSYLYL